MSVYCCQGEVVHNLFHSWYPLNGQTLGGGGSGGSIYIKSYNLEGHGIIGVNGGSGASGGAGGRIGLHLETQMYYFGSYNNLGGSGNNGYLSGGGPGSAYIKDTRKPLRQPTNVLLHLDQ
jgi:hypothetical protein